MIEEKQFLELFRNIPPELAVMIMSMLPITELRAAIPFGITAYKMDIFSAFFWGVLGNIIPPIFFIFFLEKIAQILSDRFAFWKRFFNWLFERTRKKAHAKIEKYGPWGLYILVAIPLPMTGGWTGALAAFLFGIERKKSIPVIVLGIITAGIIIVIITTGIVRLF